MCIDLILSIPNIGLYRRACLRLGRGVTFFLAVAHDLYQRQEHNGRRCEERGWKSRDHLGTDLPTDQPIQLLRLRQRCEGYEEASSIAQSVQLFEISKMPTLRVQVLRQLSIRPEIRSSWV